MNYFPKIFDVFSGAGGFSLGFEMAGCKAIAAIEQDKWAADTYKFNNPEAKMFLGNIESFSDEYLLSEIHDKPDIIIGGPPCQGFQYARRMLVILKIREIPCLLNSLEWLEYLILKH